MKNRPNNKDIVEMLWFMSESQCERKQVPWYKDCEQYYRFEFLQWAAEIIEQHMEKENVDENR